MIARLIERALGHARARVAAPAELTCVRDVASFMPMLEAIERDARDDGDLRLRLSRVRLVAPELGDLARLDPFSGTYRDAMLALYERIFGRPHAVTSEGMSYDLAHELAQPFPFSRGSAHVTGGYLVAYGFLIQQLGLSPGARILEVGCGSGALTWFFARAGLRVTALEINPSGAELTRRYCEGLDPAPRVECVDFERYDPGAERYDAIVFFESFHHLVEHVGALRRCAGWLAPGGKVALAAEPIVPAGSPIVPYPWGLRLDGESLRAMAKFGWIELGFQEPYLRDLVARTGFKARAAGLPDNPWAQVRVLERP